MSKREELNIQFYRKDVQGNSVSIFDTTNAIPINQRLSFFNSLQSSDIDDLIMVITQIQRGEFYDPDFLTWSEIYSVFDLEFVNPDFSIMGMVTIHMDDLKLLLEEWRQFRNYNL